MPANYFFLPFLFPQNSQGSAKCTGSLTSLRVLSAPDEGEARVASAPAALVSRFGPVAQIKFLRRNISAVDVFETSGEENSSPAFAASV